MTALLLGLLAGCVNHTTHLLEVELTGVITADADAPAGPVTLALMHAWSGEGELARPLLPITDVALDGPGPWSATLLYPVDDGEGLVVYGWMDGDGDGVLCSPTERTEVSGLVEVDGFPDFAFEVDLELTAPCAGPEALFP